MYRPTLNQRPTPLGSSANEKALLRGKNADDLSATVASQTKLSTSACPKTTVCRYAQIHAYTLAPTAV